MSFSFLDCSRLPTFMNRVDRTPFSYADASSDVINADVIGADVIGTDDIVTDDMVVSMGGIRASLYWIGAENSRDPCRSR